MSIIEQEAWEKQYATEFLTLIETPFKDIKSTSEFAARGAKRHVAGPDVKVTIEDQFWTRRIGIELTWYTSDAVTRQGEVALRRRSVQNRLRNELEPYLQDFPELNRFQIFASFSCQEENLCRRDCSQVVAEIAQLLGEKLTRDGCQERVFVDDDFSLFPNLQKRVSSIRVFRNMGDYRGPEGWFQNSNPGWAGVDCEPVCELIARHKRANYDLADCDECWLVIYSTGSISGSHKSCEMDRPNLSSTHIAATAANSGFEKVYFWSREWQWVAQLVPPFSCAVH